MYSAFPPPEMDCVSNGLTAQLREALQSISERLVTAYQQCLTCVQPHLEEGARTQAVQATVESTLQGNAAALAIIEEIVEGEGTHMLRENEYPWTEIGRAYAAAFTAASLVALQAPTGSPRMTALNSELARLALRAAETLAHGVGLVLGTRRSGSLVQVCAYVCTLESQADTLLRNFLASPPERSHRDNLSAETISLSGDRQVLFALEAMTDRCEDIADALLAAVYNHPGEVRATSDPASVVVGEPPAR